MVQLGKIMRRAKFGTRIWLLALATIGTVDPAAAQKSPRREPSVTYQVAPVDVYVGAYLLRIPSLSFHDNQWTAHAYVWFRWKGKLDPPPQETFALCNGTIEKRETTDAKKVRVKTANRVEEYEYVCVRVQAVVTSFWDISKYPFDKHALSLVMEDNRESSLVRYLVDADGLIVDSSLRMPGWNLGTPKGRSLLHAYPTNYGDPEHAGEHECDYSSVRFDIPLTRTNCHLYALKVFNGLYISVMIAMITFFIKPGRVDVRFGTGVGALFAAIASQYVIASSLPETGQLALVDKLYWLSSGLIFLSLLESAVAHHIHETGHGRAARVLDKACFTALAAGYVAANTWLTF
jgi:hypothetical protein